MSAPLLLVPVEQIERRMWRQWREWFQRDYAPRPLEVVGQMDAQTITHGEFLDIYATNTFKLDQMRALVSRLSGGWAGGTIFFMDAWFPSMEMLGYIRDNARHPFTIKGLLHAGCYSPSDFIAQNGCGRWGLHSERAWLTLLDEVFVGSHHHADELKRAHGELCRVTVAPFPTIDRDPLLASGPKYDIVVFPHRIADDKNPHHFDIVREAYEARYGHGVEWVRTHDLGLSKPDYFRLLGEAKVVFSSARHENYGVAMLEGVACGAWPVAPNRCAYPETLAAFTLYDSLPQAVEMIREIVLGRWKTPPPYLCTSSFKRVTDAC